MTFRCANGHIFEAAEHPGCCMETAYATIVGVRTPYVCGAAVWRRQGFTVVRPEPNRP